MYYQSCLLMSCPFFLGMGDGPGGPGGPGGGGDGPPGPQGQPPGWNSQNSNYDNRVSRIHIAPCHTFSVLFIGMKNNLT